MDRLFLDANVLFSAAYRKDSGLLRLWELHDVRLLTSGYALEEARRNLATVESRNRLDRLMRVVEVRPEPLVKELASGLELADKDRPVLAAAIQSRASHLITGDRRHFGHLFGQRFGPTLVSTPRDYLAARH